ncbi:MAG: hypothetical protein WBA25_19710 [Jannaschia sp.]
MADMRGPLDKVIDTIKDKLAEVLGALAPQHEAIPVPIRNDPRDPRGPLR